jgi:hypothetical protein
MDHIRVANQISQLEFENNEFIDIAQPFTESAFSAEWPSNNGTRGDQPYLMTSALQLPLQEGRVA